MSQTISAPPTPPAPPKRAEGETLFWQRCDAFVQYIADLGGYLATFVTQVAAVSAELLGYRNAAMDAAETAALQADAATTNGAAQVSLAAAQVALATAQADKSEEQAWVAKEEARKAIALAGSAVTAASTTSLDISSGEKALIVDADKAFVPGCVVALCSSSNPSGVWMRGEVQSYNKSTGQMVVRVNLTVGTGSCSAWSVRIVQVAAGEAAYYTHFLINS